MMIMTACSLHAPKVPEDVKAKYTSNLPKATVTNFNEAVACMDDLMLASKVAPIYISSQGLTNYTSDHTISQGGIEMLITTLSKMSIRSNAVRFVSYNSDIANMMTLQGVHPNRASFKVPDYFIRGGITAHNKSLWSGQRGAGASVEFEEPDIIDSGTFFTLRGQEDATTSYSMSSSYGTLTIDMSAGFISNLQIVPGVASSNTLALENRKGKAVSADLGVGDLGLSYSLSSNKTFDYNTVYRSLVQVGVIEIIGKLQNVPYWRCLANAGSVEYRDEQLLKKYIELELHKPEALIETAQIALTELSYYSGEINSQLNDETKMALQAYQQQMGLMATGIINFETYRMMNLYQPTREEKSLYWWKSALNTPDVVPQAETKAGKK
ncbi:hypothetical protein TDB9533_03927 [Thalassocella blandensis]|nr:hypothetical protein TDB9533_03927 [Thalassocella blandensis]